MKATFPGLDSTLGPVEIGVILGTFLLGIETLQTFNYYRQFPDDSVLLKTTVAVLWLLALGHTVCALHVIYSMTVTFYGDTPTEHILNPPRSLGGIIVSAAITNCVVQIFFGNRIRVLSGDSRMAFLCFFLSFLRFLFETGLVVAFWVTGSGFPALQSSLRWEMTTASAIGPVIDGVIATWMCYCLWHLRGSESNFERMRQVLDTLILWTVETTIITSLAGIIQLILFLARSDLSFIVFFLIQPKLFSNSMLAVLNGRVRFRAQSPAGGITASEALAFTSSGTTTEPQGGRRTDDGAWRLSGETRGFDRTDAHAAAIS
ncbi:hypothetical protein DFH09DRAFT_1164697 [Mycena vulgaris]|nr:hypothetical protein DFH09DRAFT_1164697 [Mycena vulgaris]